MSDPLRQACGWRRAASLLVAALLATGTAAPAAGGCSALGGRVVCSGRAAHAEVGRTLIFPQGPPAARSGHYVRERPESLPGVLPRDDGGAREAVSRPLNRADGLTDPTKGRDFGAYEFPSGPGMGFDSLRRE